MKAQDQRKFSEMERVFDAVNGKTPKPLKERVDLAAANARALDAEADALIDEYVRTLVTPGVPHGNVRACEVENRAFGLSNLRGLLALQKKLGGQ
jgi:hypothetical protein